MKELKMYDVLDGISYDIFFNNKQKARKFYTQDVDYWKRNDPSYEQPTEVELYFIKLFDEILEEFIRAGVTRKTLDILKKKKMRKK